MMLVAESLPRKPCFDSMVTPDGIRSGQAGSSVEFLQNSGEFTYQMLLHQCSTLINYPLTVSTGLLDVAETRHGFSPHLQGSNLGKFTQSA